MYVCICVGMSVYYAESDKDNKTMSNSTVCVQYAKIVKEGVCFR